jgi:hypothetical protein
MGALFESMKNYNFFRIHALIEPKMMLQRLWMNEQQVKFKALDNKPSSGLIISLDLEIVSEVSYVELSAVQLNSFYITNFCSIT